MLPMMATMFCMDSVIMPQCMMAPVYTFSKDVDVEFISSATPNMNRIGHNVLYLKAL